MNHSRILKETLTVLTVLEELGREFYSRQSQMQSDLHIRTLLTMLMNDEARHQKICEDLAHRWRIEISDSERMDVEMQTMDYFGLDFSVHIERFDAALEFAMELERGTIRYLRQLEPYIPAEEKTFLSRLIHEEQEHMALLAEVRSRQKTKA